MSLTNPSSKTPPWNGSGSWADGVGHGSHLAPSERAAGRDSFGEVVLVGTSSLTQTNRVFHGMLGDGISAGENPLDGNLFRVK